MTFADFSSCADAFARSRGAQADDGAPSDEDYLAALAEEMALGRA